MELQTYVAMGFFGVTGLHSLYNIYKTYQNHKRETIAILQSKDLDDEVLSIDPNKDSFSHKEETYLISKDEKCYVVAGKKKFCLYTRNTPEPKQLYETLQPANDTTAEQIYALINSEALKMLNQPQGMLGGFTTQQIMIAGGIIVAAIIMFG